MTITALRFIVKVRILTDDSELLYSRTALFSPFPEFGEIFPSYYANSFVVFVDYNKMPEKMRGRLRYSWGYGKCLTLFGT